MSRRYYFSTRDLLMMAALAALGGVAGTYINAVGDFFQSILGFAGTTQWAAGLHVLWLILAVGLTGKQGSGTITGLLKGVVELLSGNTHGLLVLLVDIVAGILVDLVFLFFRRRESLPAYALAGGLASASNVFVFQLFAALPADVLAYGALLLVGLVAFASGVLFAGLLGRLLLNTLRRTGVVRDRAPTPMSRRAYLAFLLAAVLVALGLLLFLRQALRGPAEIAIGGAVQAPYTYPQAHDDIETRTAEATVRGTTSRYTGIPLRELLGRAQPAADASLVLVQAADGYAFFLSMQEVQENDSLLLVPKGRGEDAAYDLVGPLNSKAWVRGVQEITVMGRATLPIEGALERAAPFDPNDWQFDMDSTQLDLGDGPRKYQGLPLGSVLQAQKPLPEADRVLLHRPDSDPLELALEEVLADDGIGLYTRIGETEISFAIARIEGEVLAAPVQRIEVR
ncbi:MAG: ECF transporter S component [Chloroflexia bacterium]|nr:ECF transporter S component [Chloroflexia bacterium]